MSFLFQSIPITSYLKILFFFYRNLAITEMHMGAKQTSQSKLILILDETIMITVKRPQKWVDFHLNVV